jgi:hypothetical protein
MQFNQGFIGYEPNQSLEFSGSDREQRFNSNLKSSPNDWYYRTADITYNYNSLGHRSIEPTNLNLDNYILFTGCSHTEGLGLELEKTYPYIISSELQCDYYNLALGGSGIDTMTHNLITWLNHVKTPPKALVIQWPKDVRFLTIRDNDRVTLHLPKNSLGFSPNIITTGDVPRFMVAGDTIGYFKSKKKLSSMLINNCYRESNIVNIEPKELAIFDYARDMLHCGIVSNDFLAKRILKNFN